MGDGDGRQSVLSQPLPLQPPCPCIIDKKRYTVGGISERIHQIFSISLANFVFPLFFNITQIFLARTDKQPTTGVMVVVVNNYVTVMGVLCATLWFSGSEWVRTHSQPVRDHRFSCMPNLELAHGPEGKHGSEILVIGRSFGMLGAVSLDTSLARDSMQITIPGRRDSYMLG
ncbi:hypothetical protein EDC04DRAFT_2023050 [Pisolithus marmoratus]|nr:hypothetical protein EDC04DRAFT_2023050 [Pisolithus marmoratus]